MLHIHIFYIFYLAIDKFTQKDKDEIKFISVFQKIIAKVQGCFLAESIVFNQKEI